MLYLSVSAIKDYLLCPKIYWYRVHKKEAFIPNEFITRGNFVHKTIEKCNNLDDAIIYLNGLYRGIGSYVADDRIKSKLEAIKMLQNYYTKIEPTLPARNPEFIEKMFKISWSTGVYLVGKMDRITLHKVYDWKTSIKLPDMYELQDMQFYIYWWAYQKIYGSKPEIYYGHLYTGDLLPIDIHEDMWYNIEKLIDEVAGYLISTGASYPRLFGYKCKSCFYKGVCWSDYELGN